MHQHRLQLWLALTALVGLVMTVIVVGQPSATVVGQAQLHDNEVGRLFDGPLPGLSERRSTPTATGSRRADKRIRDVALARGYRLHGEPLDPMGSYQGRQLQQRAIDDLVELQAAMWTDTGASLRLTSGFRGAERQRELFIDQLRSSSLNVRGRVVTNNEIGLGLADDVVNHAMRIAAPPGFSRHHTGLTIDVASNGLTRFQFADSTAYDWLTENRYANAMTYGWVPSYPPKASAQGPRSEPWEWVWIGRDTAKCALQQICVTGSLDSMGDRTVGWAVGTNALPPQALRILTNDATMPLAGDPIPRFDVAIALGLDHDRVGFDVALAQPVGASWACVEARQEPGGPWNRIGCLTLPN